MNIPFLRLKKNTKITILTGLVVLGLYFGFSYFASQSFVPDNFQEARQDGSVVSAELVDFLKESINNLEVISEEDKNYNFSKALDLVYEELERTKATRQRAMGLTVALDKMARAVPNITPTKARNLALEAVSSEVALISHLIIYNDSLNGLLETLRYKFSGDIRYDVKDIQVLVKNMNQEAREINALNDLFNKKMQEFDEIVN